MSADTGRTPLARATDLVLRYDGHLAVDRSSLELPAGEVTAIIGPNGSGKSTLLHALAGLHEVAAGRLEVLGTSAARAQSQIAYVMQHVAVPEGVPITVREVVAMGRYPTLGWWRRPRREDRERVRAALAALEIEDLAARHLGELSGGQRQRVYVAQALAQDHVAIFLDEPLTGLDMVSARAIDRIIHSEHEAGHSVVLTTHDLEEARAADQVVLMAGRVVAWGRPDEVLTPANLTSAYGLGALHGDTQGLFLDDPHAHDPGREDGISPGAPAGSP